jgi:hypothetical protein
MNLTERQAVVKAMDIMVRTINDECIMDSWLMCGVADGDINIDTPINEVDEYYCTDAELGDLMTRFLKLMGKASANGLYVDGVVSGSKSIEWSEPYSMH